MRQARKFRSLRQTRDTARKDLGDSGGTREEVNSGERKAEESLDHVNRHHRHMEGALKVHIEMESARQRR
jgi:hypothetical protein